MFCLTCDECLWRLFVARTARGREPVVVQRKKRARFVFTLYAFLYPTFDNQQIQTVMIYTQYTLPAPATEIIGREKEADELQKLLLTDEVRLVTLTGPGGIGKTRLAIHVASLMTDSFDDGVYFVPLAHVSNPALFFLTLAQALDIQPDTSQLLQEPVIRYFRQREILLVLDNFEQIVGAAADVAVLLSTCPRLTILVTSRIVLHVRGEYEYPVLPLALPAVNASMEVESLSHYAAVLLFVQRATAVRPDFRLTITNAVAIAEICMRLDGLPLAIELAAARTKLLTPQAMLPRLQHRLQLLRGGAIDLPERQQTLYNTIRWSYELLDEQEQQVFNRLAVFQGYWDLEAASALCGDVTVDAMESILSLVDKSMVQQREMSNGETMFVLLETLREFAREQLKASGEESNIAARHADYYLAVAESHREEHSDEQYLAWSFIVEATFDNFRSAFLWLLGSGEAEKAARLFLGLAEFWSSRGIPGEHVYWRDLLLPHIAGLQHYLKAAVLNMSGHFYRDYGNLEAARQFFTEALALAGDTPQGRKLYYSTLSNLAITHALAREFEVASRLYEEALGQQQALGHAIESAITMTYYAHTAEITDNTPHAQKLLEDSIAVFNSLGLQRRVAASLGLLASLLSRFDKEQARIVANEALVYCRKFGHKRGEIRLFLVLADIACTAGNYEEAGHCLLECLHLSRLVDSHRALMPTLLFLSDLFYAVSAFELSVQMFAFDVVLMKSFETEYESTFVPLHEEDVKRLRAAVGDSVYDRIIDSTREIDMHRIELLVRAGMEQYVFTKAEPESQPVPVPSSPTREQKADVDMSGLTTREKELLQLLAQGLSNKEIGEKLFISPRTVHAHVRSIYSKINVSSRSAATRFAVENGLA